MTTAEGCAATAEMDDLAALVELQANVDAVGTAAITSSSSVYERWTLSSQPVNYGYFAAETSSPKDHGSLVDTTKDETDAAKEDTTFYITTAINYTNGPGHMGHAYEAATADVIARHRRLLLSSSSSSRSANRNTTKVYFVTGTDEHGQKIAEQAAKEGLSPIQICDKYVTGFQVLNQRIRISHNDYVRTTSARHQRTAQELWRRCAHDIYLDIYTGWYSVREESFVTETEAALSDYKDPVSGLPFKRVEEESYFFKMSKYKDRLLQYIEVDNPDFIQPVHHRNLILQRLQSDELRDLSISRTTFDWGISVPEGFRDHHVMYVWMDALSNYLTGVNALNVNDDDDDDSSPSGLERFWPANVHIIGKDILWFHTVIWPCLLMSANLALPKTVFAHGFVNDKEGKKMSKSMGNVVDPHDMLDKFDVDTFRWYVAYLTHASMPLSASQECCGGVLVADLFFCFGYCCRANPSLYLVRQRTYRYLCKEAPYGGELSFSEDSMRDMHNADLCGTLGNLVHRATSLCGKYCGGVVPDVPAPPSTALPIANVADVIDSYNTKMNSFDLQGGANVAIQGFRDINGYLQDQAPWHIRDDLLAQQVIVRATLEAVYALAHLLLPFLPEGGAKIFCKLGTDPVSGLAELDRGCRNLKVGTKIDVGEILYKPSLSDNDKEKDAAAVGATGVVGKKKESHAEAQQRKKEAKAKLIAASKAGQATGGDDNDGDANQSDFTKMDIRVGKIVKVWDHETADKLFCEQIDVGDADGPREIASGLREHYSLDDMQDRKVLVVCNLKAAKIVGFSSNGMVLAAKSPDGSHVELIDAPADATIGERVFIDGQSPGEALSSTQIKKKKVWETVAANLKTAEGGVATWEGHEIQTSAGVCKAATLVGAPIS